MSAAPEHNAWDAGEDRAGPDPTLARAEELVDRFGERAGSWLSHVGRDAERLLARAREEAEDIWAEAQSLRHNGRGGASQP
jgi:hypothetical protein